MAEYAGVLMILTLAVLLLGALLLLQLGLGPRRASEEKLEPFECGESPTHSPRMRYAVKFYLVAILFVVFDVVAIFLYLWATVFRELGRSALVGMALFTLPAALGLFYLWRKGALEW